MKNLLISLPRNLSVALIFALVASTPTAAQQRTIYDIEIIIFRNLNVPSTPQEYWPSELLVPGFDSAVNPYRPGAYGQKLGFANLEQSRLIGEAKQLQDAGRYKILTHLAWRQPGFNSDESVPVRIVSGEGFDVFIPEAKQSTTPKAGINTYDNKVKLPRPHTEPEPRRAVINRSALSFSGSGKAFRTFPLDGSVTLVRSRYLHLFIDLIYTDPSQLKSVRIKQHRRMRSKTLHYIDHPLLGILVSIIPANA